MGRVIALDVGEATLGVAVSDPLGLTAQPVGTIRRKNIRKDLDAVAEIIERYEATSVVVGLPLALDPMPTLMLAPTLILALQACSPRSEGRGRLAM